MTNFRRNWFRGGTLFFTVVTAGRSPLFLEESACRLLSDCLRIERAARPFAVDAIVVLPDHMHTIWTLSPGDSEFAKRWASIKSRFTREWLKDGRCDQTVLPGQHREGRRGIWQPRYMEHTIRDEDDLIRHVDYIHFNPVKHGLVNCPREWPRSSFLRYVTQGDYPVDCACSQGGLVPRFDGVDVDLVE
jgi:putative transposase